MSRGVSTVVDATLCLLLVSAAAVTLAGVDAEPDPRPPDAGRVAEALTVTTATVEYRLPAGPVAEDRPRNRTANGTLAALLADAARVDRRADGGFATSVRAHVARWLRQFPGGVQVRVAADRRQPLVVGGSPPHGAAVDAATLRFDGMRVVVRRWSA